MTIAMPGEPIFLTLEHVLELHRRQIERFGGVDGVRDLGLIESAIAEPAQTFAGAYLHQDLGEMAGAYLFHLAKNHGFIDGNKRVAVASALVFLELNGIDTDQLKESELEAITFDVADGSVDKQAAMVFSKARVVTEE